MMKWKRGGETEGMSNREGEREADGCNSLG